MLRPYLQYLFGRCWNRIAVTRATPLGHHSVAEKLRYLCSSQELCWLLAPGTTPRKQPATSTGFSSPEVWQVQTRGITHKYHMADNTWQLQCREKTLKASAGVFIQCTSYYSSHTFYKYIWKKNSHGADSNNEKILFGPQQQLAEIQRGIQLPTCPTNIPYGSVMPYSKSKGFMSIYVLSLRHTRKEQRKWNLFYTWVIHKIFEYNKIWGEFTHCHLESGTTFQPKPFLVKIVLAALEGSAHLCQLCDLPANPHQEFNNSGAGRGSKWSFYMRIILITRTKLVGFSTYPKTLQGRSLSKEN